MWKPAEVVREHRRRAVVLWVVLIAGIISYSGYLIYRAVHKRANPSTSFVLSNDLYRFPDVYVCLYELLGCDKIEWEGECRNSLWDVEETTKATFNLEGDDKQEIGVGSVVLDDFGHCVKFNVSDVEFSGDQRNPEDYVLLDMYWYPGGSANSSLTCVQDGEKWQPHSESVSVFLRDPETGHMSAGTQMPYNCINSASDRHVFNFMGISLTEEFPLFGPDKKKYKPTTLITSTKKDAVYEAVTTPYAYLSLEVAQAVDSYEKIKEIDPLEVAEIFGSVGGFWDLLLMLWPFFFVAVTQKSDPPLKFRDFNAQPPRPRRRRGTRGVIGFGDNSDPKKVRPRIIAPSTQRVVSESRQTQRDESEFSRDASTRQNDRMQHIC